MLKSWQVKCEIMPSHFGHGIKSTAWMMLRSKHGTNKPRYVPAIPGPVGAGLTNDWCPMGAGDSRVIAGLKYHVLTSALFPQCHGTTGLLIPCPN